MTDRRSGTWARGIALLAVGLLALAGCSSVDAPKIVDGDAAEKSTPSSSAAAPGISEAVFEGLGQAVDDGLVRWDQDSVDLSVRGDSTPRDLEILDETLAQFEQFSGLTFNRVPTGGDIDVAFIAHDQWPAPDTPPELGPDGQPIEDLGLTTWEADPGGAMTDAQVYIDPAMSQALRNSTISHELTHALGLGHVECITSIIDDGTHLDLDWVPTPFDRDLISSWYDPDVPLLTTRGELGDHLEVSAGGTECAPWLLEGVEVEGETLACEVAFAQYRPCMAYDGAGPLPSLDAWAPTAWVDDQTVYTFDPARYEEIEVAGARVLCELGSPSDDRRPCQTTDGPGPITEPDMWTDGELVYDSP